MQRQKVTKGASDSRELTLWLRVAEEAHWPDRNTWSGEQQTKGTTEWGKVKYLVGLRWNEHISCLVR